ncbi:MAG TPA: peptidoglycan-binding domain-containing protein [Xanthobacteraceae bacterium]|nr:peptidoglycan-binding domain-containing protein [Xanthobacteraceae bacterium]
MKKLLLATIATAAISFPAMAQQTNPSNQSNMPNKSMSTQSDHNATTGQGSSSMQKNQSGTTGSSANQGGSNQSAQQTISPDNLNQSQVRQIQQALDKKGFSVGRTDGKWGPETEAALRKFQEDQKMSSSGQLDDQTIGALGLNTSEFGAQTTGQGGNQNGTMKNMDRMKNQNGSTSGQSEGSGGHMNSNK